MQRASRYAVAAVLLCAAICLFSACALFQGGSGTEYQTGQILNDLGRQFIATGDLYDRAVKQGLISGDEYAEWANFSAKFQTAYKAAYLAWLTGEAGNPDAVLAMRNDLILFALQIAERVR